MSFSYHRTPFRGDASQYGSGSPPWNYCIDDNIDTLRSYMLGPGPWSPIEWKDGKRLSDNFISAHWMALDFDGGMDLAEALNTFCDMIHIIGTTRSHQISKNGLPPCDRFRVVLKFEQPIFDGKLFKFQLERAVRIWGSDNAAKDAGRPFWPCKEIISVNRDGHLQEVYALPKPRNSLIRQRENAGHLKNKTLPQKLAETFNVSLPMGVRNDRFNSTFYQMFLIGYSKEEATEMFLNSPTFKDNRERGFQEQILRTMESAWKAANKNKGDQG